MRYIENSFQKGEEKIEQFMLLQKFTLQFGIEKCHI